MDINQKIAKEKMMKRTLRGVSLISGGASTCLRVIQEENPGGALWSVSETVAVIASTDDVSGIQNLKDIGYPADDIHVVNPKNGYFATKLLMFLDKYKPDFFHQLGWMPLTPDEIMDQYVGLNQHLGPGGKWMYGVRRVYAHMRFCQEVGRIIPISVFCQFVDPVYDAGKVLSIRNIDLDFSKTPEQNAEMLLPIEHEVQIAGRMELFFDKSPSDAQLVPNIAKSLREEEILFAMKKEARDKYPPEA